MGCTFQVEISSCLISHTVFHAWLHSVHDKVKANCLGYWFEHFGFRERIPSSCLDGLSS